ncbi:MAG: hypothetical protein KGL53_02675 [Elusimicrobia bacterium]|nr:hypothetical protein [Elusimicrobiota bacterium]
MTAVAALPPGSKTRLGRMLGYGVWAGVALGTAVMSWNVHVYGNTLTDLGPWTFAHALIYVSVGAVVGYVLWGGYLLKG